MLNTAYKYNQLNDSGKKEFNVRLLNRVYASFFVFEAKKNKNINIKEVISCIVETEFSNYKSSIITDVSDLINSNELDNVRIGKSYIIPFLKIKYAHIKHKGQQSVEKLFEEFISTFYQYICVSEINGKIVVFTDIGEMFLTDSFKKLDKKGYKKVELHSIIPKIIDLVIDNIHKSNSNDSIRELGIHFPLSMLGDHSEIIGKIKEGKQIIHDSNFKKLISYGLLDAVKLNTDFNLSFNNGNDSDKYRLYGLLFSGNYLNEKVFNELGLFINYIDSTKGQSENNNFAGLPIYVISSKKIYENKDNYPYFSYNCSLNKRTNKFEVKLELHFGCDGNNGINGSYQITGIYPQYFKERNNKDIKGAYCYLKRNNIKDEWLMSDERILEIFGDKKKIRCDDFLNQVRKGFALNFKYEPELSGGFDEGNQHPDVSASDLFLTALNEDNIDNDYLINITTTKRANQIKLGHQITINIYKLSSFNFNFKNIENINNNYFNKNIKFTYFGTISKVLDKKGHEFQINGDRIFHISNPCTDAKGNNEGKTIQGIFNVTDLGLINKKSYLSNKLKLEDIWSLAFVKILEQKGHKAYFGGRIKGGNTRELADVISIDSYKNKIGRKIVNINLFHMKKEPFEQLRECNYSIAFSTYTVVVGQVLEKIKSFLYQKNYDEIIDSLESFFEKDDGNYEIFEQLRDTINSNRDNVINFNIIFPVKEKDYFYNSKTLYKKNNYLSLITNWKRLKIISDIFKSNVDNVASKDYKMKIKLNLGLLICRGTKKYNLDCSQKGNIETNVKVINNIENNLFNKFGL